jgi:UDP-N-acetylglucosamine 1-carboxyvinyltransferase
MPEELTKKFRASVVLTGPLLARFGRVSLPHPGGCLIGARPIDLFLEAYKKMGARVIERHGSYDIRAPKGLHGAEIFMRNQSVTGTQTIMLAALLAKGKTVIKNAAMEPEIPHLVAFLNKCGAKISGAGTPTITVTGGRVLLASGNTYKTPPDRIETGSFLILGVLAAKDLTITDCQPQDLEVIIETLRLISSSKITTTKDTINIKNKNKPVINPISIKTHEYPGFPTDLQAPMAVLLTQAKGESLIFETIFEGRLGYAEELSRMGAKISLWDPHRLMVFGPHLLSGKKLTSPDIRAGLALLLAAIIAKGESVIHNVYYIDRGYEAIEKRLLSIGVPIKRIEMAEEAS